MTFKNKSIYVADLNQAKNYRGKDTDFEYAKYDTDLVLKDCIVIKVANDLYVPLLYFKNFLSKIIIQFSLKFERYEVEDKFISTRPNANTKELYFLTNIRKLNYTDERVSLETLKQSQKELDYENGMPSFEDFQPNLTK